MGALRYLMQSESFLQIRNQTTVQTDGMGAVGLDDKHPMYQRMTTQLKNDFLAAARKYKNQVNIARGFGGMSSGYQNVTRFDD